MRCNSESFALDSNAEVVLPVCIAVKVYLLRHRAGYTFADTKWGVHI
jgi:hypothetical protein